MLYRSFGAVSFAGFWRAWNPLFGYYLSTRVYSPVQRFVSEPVALAITFVVCGAIHDLVTALARGSAAFFFIPWFFFLGLGVLLGRALGVNLARQPWAIRAGVNLAYLAVCLALTLAAARLFRFP
ncbi:MAG: acyltransferase [Chthoniobacterales bacterium]